jgi:hypothetical protein
LQFKQIRICEFSVCCAELSSSKRGPEKLLLFAATGCGILQRLRNLATSQARASSVKPDLPGTAGTHTILAAHGRSRWLTLL